MQQRDQSEKIDAPEETPATPSGPLAEIGNDDEHSPAESEDSDDETVTAAPRTGFDWLALSIALVVAAFFALTARFNSQPSPSFIPAAVFSATGCGLLVTALHTLRARSGAGLREAALAGFAMALFQFAVTFTYPDVFQTVKTVPEYGHAFLVTWGLVALFTTVLSVVGAAIGHLVFAPLRPLPARALKRNDRDEDEDDEELEVQPLQANGLATTSEQEAMLTEQAGNVDAETDAEEESLTEQAEDADGEADEEEPAAATVASPGRPLVGYAIALLLLGLLPMMAGYVFAAVYDFTMNAMNVNAISPALYPTLSLLSGLLPWRLAAPINLTSANGSFIVFTLLWRIPDSVLGNPNLFDVQALETFVFNAAALALLLITSYSGYRTAGERRSAPWGIFLLLEALFGLILILPASLWMLRGLEGVLQFRNLVAQLPTIQLLNPTLFLLNLATGALFCVLVGLVVRRQYQLWTLPRKSANIEGPV